MRTILLSITVRTEYQLSDQFLICLQVAFEQTTKQFERYPLPEEQTVTCAKEDLLKASGEAKPRIPRHFGTMEGRVQTVYQTL